MGYHDCHVHFQGTEEPSRVIDAMDRADIERIGAFSPDPGTDESLQQKQVAWMADFAAASPERFVPFAWINPTLPGAVELTERALTEYGFTGIKVVPNHWHPYDESLTDFWTVISEHHASCIAHTGILWGYGDSSRFCRPVDFEVLIRFPGIRFALAHIGWPWTDECIALAGRFAAEGIGGQSISSQQHAPRPEPGTPSRMYIDITLGAPRPYRRDALARAIAVVGDERLLYGSDCSTPEDSDGFRSHLEIDRELLRGELGLPQESIHRIMHNNFEQFTRSTRT